MDYSSRLALVISEVAGPAPLVLIMMLEVGVQGADPVPTLVAALTMVVVPYGITIWLARTGRVSDRFVGDRHQRVIILAGTLLVFVAGATAVLLLGASASLRWLVITAVGGLLVVTIITTRWKVSIHATLAAFFASFQVVLFGAWGLLAVAIVVAVIWSRRVLQAHTWGQLAAGAGLGVAYAAAYVCLLAWFA